MGAKGLALLFCLLLGTLALADLLSPDRAFSDQENRYLAQRPEFSPAAVLDGGYTAELDAYVTDQFAGRDGWVGLQTLAERAMGKRSSGGAYFGGDGYLLQAFDELDEVQFARNLGYLADFTRRAGEFGVPVEVLLAPTATGVLTDKLPAHAPEVDQQLLLSAAAEALPGLVDVLPALRANREEYLYYRTDHHWTSLGAFYAYNAWRECRGLAPKELSDYREQLLSEDFLGTTYSKARLYNVAPDRITAFLPAEPLAVAVDYNRGAWQSDSIYAPAYLEGKDKYGVFLHANQAVVKIQTGADSGRRLLVIKDSYANAFVQMALPDFAEIHLLDLRYYRSSPLEYLLENQLTEVLVLYNLQQFAVEKNLIFSTQ